MGLLRLVEFYSGDSSKRCGLGCASLLCSSASAASFASKALRVVGIVVGLRILNREKEARLVQVWFV